MKILLLLLFWSLWFLNFSTRTVISPLLPIIEDELTITHALAGSIFSFLSVGYTIALLLSGFLSPRVGYKRSKEVFRQSDGTAKCWRAFQGTNLSNCTVVYL